jgi:hypothetical protein
MRNFIACVCISLVVGVSLSAKARQIKLESKAVSFTIDDETGAYVLVRTSPAENWGGTIGSALSRVMQGGGSDELGPFQSVSFVGEVECAIRVYTDRPIVLFEWSSEKALEKPPTDFPNFTSIPSGLHILSYSNRTFSLPRFDAEQDTGSPFVFFDDKAETTIISPAANFMTASLHGDGRSSVSSGFVPRLENLPAGFKHRTVLAFDHGINKTYQTWGDALVGLLDVKRPANDADVGLKMIGYWTDNRATYYYHYDKEKGYAGTLLAVADELKNLGVKFGYMQLDSWWYKKTSTGPEGKEGGAKKNAALPEGSWNKYGGLLEWTAHEDLFPNGLADFQKQIGLPFICHNRWVDLKSPYREKFQISGVGAVDPKWWDQIADYCKANGIVTYEQDWLDRIYNYSPEFQSTTDKAEAFMDNMSRATQERGVTMQYCMTLPRHYLQGAKYGNLTNVRVSDDGFGRTRWSNELYVSTLSGALGEWPWLDVFMSRDTPSILLATLSAGMVGVGDPMGQFNRQNLSLTARTDGVIVKPDRPLTPTDRSFIADASNSNDPMIAATYSQHGDLRTAYVFVYPQQPDHADFHFTAADVGVSGDAFVYDWKNKTGKKIAAGEAFTGSFGSSASTKSSDPSWAYFIVAPISPSGVALIGDEGKFVSMGQQRIEQIKQSTKEQEVTVNFAADERSCTCHGYAPLAPLCVALVGSVSDQKFDKSTGQFMMTVTPAEHQTSAVIKISTQW